MSNARKKALIAIQAVIVAIMFVVVLVLGMSATSIEAADGASVREAISGGAGYVDGLMVNGHVSSTYDPKTEYANVNSAPLRTEADIKAFLEGNKTVERWENGAWTTYDGVTATTGYLYLEENADKNSINFSWDGNLTAKLMPNNSTFDGAGKQIVLTASGNDVNIRNITPWVDISNLGSSGDTFLTTESVYNNNADVCGAFIGYVSGSSTIKNTNFVYRSQFSGTLNSMEGGTAGLISGYCNGKIDNCSLTMENGASFRVYKEFEDRTTAMGDNSVALGGFAGMLAGSSATISNSSVNLVGSSLLFASAKTRGGSSDSDNACVFLGGIAGWMGAGSTAYNLATKGTGTVEAAFNTGSNNVYGLSGIAVGNCSRAYNSSGNVKGKDVVSGTNTAGRIDGIINSWTGVAKYHYGWANVAPNRQAGDASLQSLLVGMSGVMKTRDGNAFSNCEPSNDETVSNIYNTNASYESISSYAIGHSFATKTGDNPNPRRDSVNVININRRKEGNVSNNIVTGTAPLEEAYATWIGSSDSNNKGDLVIVVDVQDDKHILWSDSVEKRRADGTVGESLSNTYFEKSVNFEEARKNYNVTYTSLRRGNYTTVNFTYDLGRAVYLKKVLNGKQIVTGDETVIAPDIEYGSFLQVPEIQLYTESNLSSGYIRTIPATDRSYWKTLKDSAMNLESASGMKEVGTYTTFLYLENVDGIDYSNIHLLDTAYHLVAYVQDDWNFKDYADAHEGYSHVDAAGVKSFEWQPRIVQQIVPKTVTPVISEPTRNTITGKALSFTNESNGGRAVEYQGSSITYSGAVASGDIVAGDADVTATLEYYATDATYAFNAENQVQSAVDVGYYLVRAVSLSNQNYTIAQDTEYKKLHITKRTTKIDRNTYVSEDRDNNVYRVNLEYNGSEQIISYGSGVNYTTQQEMDANNWAFFFYNVEEVDLVMLQVDVYGMDDTENYDATNVSQIDENGDYVGSYKVVISFSDGTASDNYNLPNITTFIVTILPAEIDFETPEQTEFFYGDIMPEEEGPYAYAIAKDGVTRVEPTRATYEQRINGNWIDLESLPSTVGHYRITYYIENESNANYLDSSRAYEIDIVQRSVTFRVTPNQQVEYTFGRSIQPGSGSFERFNSTLDTGLSVEHGRYNQVTYRYQRIGDPIDPNLPNPTPESVYPDYERLSDLDEIYALPSEIWDIGCYIVYPMLLLSCGQDHSQDHEAGYIHYVYNEYNRDVYNNYTFELRTSYVNVQKLEVKVQLKNIHKEYSKEVNWLSFAANATDANRAWSYSGNSNAYFRAEDNIILPLTTTANTSSQVGEEIPILADLNAVTGSGVNGDTSFDKANNYTVTITNSVDSNISQRCSYVIVEKLTVNVRTYLDVREITYGDELPTPTYEIEGDGFMSGDHMQENWVYTLEGEIVEGQPKNVGTYNLSVEFDTLNPDAIANYNVVINGSALLIINPKAIGIKDFEVVGDSDDPNVTVSTYVYNGSHRHPKVNITFEDDAVVEGDNISVEFNFYDERGNIVNEPQNVGTYIARIEGNKVSNVVNGVVTGTNENYVLKDVDYSEFDDAIVTITPRPITVAVNDAIRVYHIPGSLKAVKAGTDLNDRDYIDDGQLPYTLAGSFVAADNISYRLYVEESDFVDVANQTYDNVVRIEFIGDAIDAGNYDIKYTWGTLLVIDANFNEIENYLFVTFDGKRIGRDIDAKEVVYTGENLFSRFDFYVYDEAVKEVISIRFTDADGNDVNGEIRNAGTYKMVLKGDGETFSGEHTLTFTVNRAVRNLTAADIKMEVHYDRLVFSSDIAGLEYSVNSADGDDSFEPADSNKSYVYTNVDPLNNYYIKIRVTRMETSENFDPNYYESNVLELFVRTGIDAKDLATRINAIKTVTFSNLSAYRELKERINNVHADDMSLLDTNHIAALDASLEKLLSDATAAIAGAQNVAAKAVGKSNNSTSATAMALSSASLGLGAIGLMLGVVAKKRKEDEAVQEERKAKKVSGKKNAKRILSVIAIMLVGVMTVMAFVGCNDNAMKQEDILNLASFKEDSGEKSREYEITVSYGSTIVYRNENGVETSDANVNAPSFALGANGSGLDFNADYFENIAFVTSKTTATFNADVKDVSSFLGIANATNASVSVVANVDPKRLTSIEIEYYVDGFKTQIITTLTY
ncbi:MAG: hypothetical protein HDT32_04165 [Clostridiales bacterium]|nr:hypothetical protein [Clostridiales bacterium]